MAAETGYHYTGLQPKQQDGKVERLANALGWFSIGLGLAEIVAPDAVSRMIGLRPRDERRNVLRFYGLREMAAGFGILSRRRPVGWLWGRVMGDLVDLVSLGSTMGSHDVNRTRATAAAAAVMGVTALDIYCSQKMAGGDALPLLSSDGRIRVRKTITVNRPIGDVYAFWNDFENYPTFMDHIEYIRATADNRLTHWKVKAPAGMTVEWDSEIVADEPNSFIAWRSVGGDIENSGSVRFEPATGGRGTVVRLELEYLSPGGAIGSYIAKLLGQEPGQQAARGLRLMKQILETGGVTKSDASIRGGMREARPPEDEEWREMAPDVMHVDRKPREEPVSR